MSYEHQYRTEPVRLPFRVRPSEVLAIGQLVPGRHLGMGFFDLGANSLVLCCMMGGPLVGLLVFGDAMGLFGRYPSNFRVWCTLMIPLCLGVLLSMAYLWLLDLVHAKFGLVMALLLPYLVLSVPVGAWLWLEVLRPEPTYPALMGTRAEANKTYVYGMCDFGTRTAKAEWQMVPDGKGGFKMVPAPADAPVIKNCQGGTLVR